MTTNQRTEYMPASTASLIAESVGSLLRDARVELGLTVHDVSLQTKIPEKYLALFEQDAHDGLVDDVYTKIYLKAYGKFLGFETSALLDHYRKERARLGIPVRSIETLPDRHPTQDVRRSALVVTPKLVQAVLLGAVAVGLLSWIGVEVKKIIAAPGIEIAAPRDGFVTYDRSISVEGITEKEVSLTINGKQISPAADGTFKDVLSLQEGLNTIVVTGAKKHSKEMTIERRVIVLPKAEAPLEAGSVLIEEVPAEGAAAVVAPIPTPKPIVTPALAPAATETAPPVAEAPVTAETAPQETAPTPVPIEFAPVAN